MYVTYRRLQLSYLALAGAGAGFGEGEQQSVDELFLLLFTALPGSAGGTRGESALLQGLI